MVFIFRCPGVDAQCPFTASGLTISAMWPEVLEHLRTAHGVARPYPSLLSRVDGGFWLEADNTVATSRDRAVSPVPPI